jgi:hypothetical protein
MDAAITLSVIESKKSVFEPVTWSAMKEQKSIEFKPIKFISLNSTQKDPPYPLKKTKISMSDVRREYKKERTSRFQSIPDWLLETKQYKMAFMHARLYINRLKSNRLARRKFINKVIDPVNYELLADGDEYIVKGIRRLNPWLKELIIYLIWKTNGRALKSLWCKLDFPSIELLLKLQVELCPRDAEENDQIQKVKDILCERQNQLLNISGLCPDIIKMICQY